MSSRHNNHTASGSPDKSDKKSDKSQVTDIQPDLTRQPEGFTLYYFDLAAQLGDKAALFIAHLHDLLDNPDIGHFHDGRKWIRLTNEGWCEQLLWKPRTFQRIVKKLKDLDVLIVRQIPAESINRTNHYTLNYQQLAQVYQWSPLSQAENAAYLAYEKEVG